MNWHRGLRRIWYAILGLSWVIFIAAGIAVGNAARFGENLVYMLIFTLVWLGIGGVLVWIARGFQRDA